MHGRLEVQEQPPIRDAWELGENAQIPAKSKTNLSAKSIQRIVARGEGAICKRGTLGPQTSQGLGKSAFLY